MDGGNISTNRSAPALPINEIDLEGQAHVTRLCERSDRHGSSRYRILAKCRVIRFYKSEEARIKGSPAKFTLGNSKYRMSIGTMTLDWAFSESPHNLSQVDCDVLPVCNYPMILGSRFLTATQTLSKHRRRLIECSLSTVNTLRMNLLECDQSRIHGSLGGYDQEVIKVAAVPDTGAEGNIMDGAFGIGHSSYVYSGPSHRNLLQFADGTYQETVGQVQTNWTFASSECIPLIFEVLENCCSDVVLGDTILYDYNVFEDHAASILSYESLDSMLQLAPFDFVKNWQRNPSSLLPGHKNRKLRINSIIEAKVPEAERQEAWNCRFSFGETATEAEKSAELHRRNLHKLASQSLSSPWPPGAQS